MKRRLRRWWPVGVVVGVFLLEANSSFLGAFSGFPLVLSEVVFAGIILARLINQRSSALTLLIPIGFGLGDLAYGLNHYIFKVVYHGPFEPLIYAVPYVIGMTSLSIVIDRVQKTSPDHERLRGLSWITAMGVFGLNVMCIIGPILSKTPAPQPTVAVLSVVFSVLESLIVGQLAVLSAMSIVPAFQIGLFGILAVNFSDIAIRYSSAYANEVGLVAPEFGWLLGYALVVVASNIWAETSPSFRMARLMSVRTWTTGFLIAGLSFGWFAIASFLGWKDAKQVSMTLWISLLVFGMAVPLVHVILGQLETLVDSIRAGRGLITVSNPAALPEEVTVVSRHLQDLNQRIASERDHALNLSAEIAHNLGSPVIALRAAQYRVKRHPEFAKVASDLDLAIDAIESVSARVLEEKKRLIGLETVERSIDSTVALMKSVHPTREIEVNVARDASAVPVLGLGEVLRNLIQNALEASAAPASRVLVTAHGVGSEFVVEVSDLGSGIPEPVLAAIRRGELTTQKVHGNGIGLSSAHSWARDRGYGFEIHSSMDKDNHGTRISILIPRSAWAVPKDRMEGLET